MFLDCSSGKGWCKDWQPSCQQYPLDRMYLGLICGVVGVGGGVGGIGNVGPDLGVKGSGGSALVQLVLRAVSWSFTSMSGVVG